jgi:alkyl hydroperoxide reductase subunit AhpC
MTLQLGDIAPNFHAETTDGPLTFHEWSGESWVLLFSHPADFTPVCTTELGRVAQLKPEFAKRNVKLICISVDTMEHHQAWVSDIGETQGTAVNFPIIADPERKIALDYDMIHPNASATASVRAVYLIDPEKRIRLILIYPMAAGRNFDEILRATDAIQYGDDFSVATPVNWQRGDDVIIPLSIDDETAKTKFPKGWHAPKPYLRITPDPSA